MSNEKNLIPFDERTETEQRKIAQAGGIASGKARRRKRSMKEAADLYLSLPETDRRTVNAMLRDQIDPEEYQPAARMLAYQIDPSMKVFDPTTFETERLMYWPSRSSDSESVCQYTPDGDRVTADELLSWYADWRDVRQWPACPAETISRPGGKQADPTIKTGAVGAFCRVYDIPAAIDKFLPGVYIDAGQGRLTYAAGSTTAGAVLYDDDHFLYSHHSTDPAGGKLLNAWDLVRIHRFGDLDADAAPGTPADASFLAPQTAWSSCGTPPETADSGP